MTAFDSGGRRVTRRHAAGLSGCLRFSPGGDSTAEKWLLQPVLVRYGKGEGIRTTPDAPRGAHTSAHPFRRNLFRRQTVRMLPTCYRGTPFLAQIALRPTLPLSSLNSC